MYNMQTIYRPTLIQRNVTSTYNTYTKYTFYRDQNNATTCYRSKIYSFSLQISNRRRSEKSQCFTSKDLQLKIRLEVL